MLYTILVEATRLATMRREYRCVLLLWCEGNRIHAMALYPFLHLVTIENPYLAWLRSRHLASLQFLMEGTYRDSEDFGSLLYGKWNMAIL